MVEYCTDVTRWSDGILGCTCIEIPLAWLWEAFGMCDVLYTQHLDISIWPHYWYTRNSYAEVITYLCNCQYSTLDFNLFYVRTWIGLFQLLFVKITVLIFIYDSTKTLFWNDILFQFCYIRPLRSTHFIISKYFMTIIIF